MPKRPAAVGSPTTLLLSVVALLAAASPAAAQEQPKRGPGAIPGSDPRTTSPVRFVSPLRSFTIFDKADAIAGSGGGGGAASPQQQQQRKSPRSRFLTRFRSGLLAERAARDVIAAERRAELARMDPPPGSAEDDDDSSAAQFGERWAELEEAKEEVRRGEDEVRVEMAYDRATARFNDEGGPGTSPSKREPSSSSGSAYQFVGVVNPPGGGGGDKKKKVTWYARPKPPNSKWSLRVVHVDRDAIVRDMFVNGKVDIYGEYVNTGRTVVESADPRDRGGEERKTRMPIVEGRYKVKERSWKNLWNFNPKHMFTDSSGMYWRERRLTPGLYTDGKLVYEAAYRYGDGRAGMKPVSNLDAFLRSSTVRRDVKEDVLTRLREGAPDVVVEE